MALEKSQQNSKIILSKCTGAFQKLEHCEKAKNILSIKIFINQLCLTVLSQLQSSLLLVHFFLQHFSLPVNFLLICSDTALCQQPGLSAMACGLSSLWKASMSLFWTAVKSALLPVIVMIVALFSECMNQICRIFTDWKGNTEHFHNILIFWDTGFFLFLMSWKP